MSEFKNQFGESNCLTDWMSNKYRELRKEGWKAALKWKLSRFPNKLGSYDLRKLEMEIEEELKEVENE